MTTPQMDIAGTGTSFVIRHAGRIVARANSYDNACVRARTVANRLQQRPARCMCCGAGFIAHSRWNRLCDACKETYA